MSQPTSKLNQRQQEDVQTHQTAAQEFQTPEELIRYDAGQTTVPPAIAARLKEAMANQPRQPLPWWRRWFGRR